MTNTHTAPMTTDPATGCYALGPDELRSCTREKGHDGDHVAHGPDRQPVESWPASPYGPAPARPTTDDLDRAAEAADEAVRTAAHALMAAVEEAGACDEYAVECARAAITARKQRELTYALWSHDPDHPHRLEPFTGGATGTVYTHSCVLCAERTR